VYGHSWFVDPAKRLTVTVLTNTAVEGMSGQFPMQIREALYATL
jgi:CubicO group peptidase (beta-lactamase class C family)